MGQVGAPYATGHGGRTIGGPAAAQRGWEPSCPVDTLLEAPQLYVDAAETPWGAYMVGLWGLGGARIRRCPVWVTSQQSAELWGVVVAMDEMRKLRTMTARVYIDNAGALAMIFGGGRGRAYRSSSAFSGA